MNDAISPTDPVLSEQPVLSLRPTVVTTTEPTKVFSPPASLTLPTPPPPPRAAPPSTPPSDTKPLIGIPSTPLVIAPPPKGFAVMSEKDDIPAPSPPNVPRSRSNTPPPPPPRSPPPPDSSSRSLHVPPSSMPANDRDGININTTAVGPGAVAAAIAVMETIRGGGSIESYKGQPPVELPADGMVTVITDRDDDHQRDHHTNPPNTVHFGIGMIENSDAQNEINNNNNDLSMVSENEGITGQNFLVPGPIIGGGITTPDDNNIIDIARKGSNFNYSEVYHDPNEQDEKSDKGIRTSYISATGGKVDGEKVPVGSSNVGLPEGMASPSSSSSSSINVNEFLVDGDEWNEETGGTSPTFFDK